jgi:WD40 repeat protein
MNAEQVKMIAIGNSQINNLDRLAFGNRSQPLLQIGHHSSNAMAFFLFLALLLVPIAGFGGDAIDDFSGLIPHPLPIPEIGKWQLITNTPQGVLRSATWSPDEKLIAVCEANHVRIYDADSLNLLKVFVGHLSPTRSVAWHPKGQQLASCSEDGTIRLWTSGGKPIHVIPAHSSVVYQVAWHPNGEQFASCSADGIIGIWGADGKQIRRIKDGDRQVFALDWSPDGNLLASVGGDIAPVTELVPGLAAVKVWDPVKGTLIRTIGPDQEHASLCVDWDSESKRLAVGYGEVYRSLQEAYAPIQGAGIKIWNVDGELEEEIETRVGSVSAIAWDPASERIAFGGRHADLWIRELESDYAFKRPSGTRDVNFVCWSRDGKKLLSTGRQAVAGLGTTDMAVGAEEFAKQLPGLANRQFMYVNWNPNGTQLAAESYDGFYFWSADGAILDGNQITGQSENWWEHAKTPISPDGNEPKLEGGYPQRMREWAWSTQDWLAGASWQDSSVRIWNNEGRLVSLLQNHRGGVESVSWNPDGEWLVSGGGDSVRIWKKDGTPGAVMKDHTDEVYRVAWSPDGKWIASGASDSVIRLWKPDGTAGPVLRGHVAGIHGLAWSPDSTKLASASWLDSMVRIWDLKTGKTIWLAILLNPKQVAVFDAAGEPISQGTRLLDEQIKCIRQTADGSCDLMDYREFRTKAAKAFKARKDK